MSANRLAALTGVLFLVLVIIGFAIGGEPPDPTEDSVQEIIDFYADNEDAIWIGSLLQTLAAGVFVFFAGYLSKVLRAAAGEGHMLSYVLLAGATIFATGMALDATINIALVESAEEIEPSGVQALSALWSNDFLVFAAGLFVFILAAGLSIVRHGGLPKWMGWVAIVLGVIAVTPAGFVGFVGTGLWVAVASVMLAMRANEATT